MFKKRSAILLAMLVTAVILSSCYKPVVKEDVYRVRNDDNRVMDMIVWYDIDHGSSSKNQTGWWPLNPQHPDRVKANGLYRTTTPLLGLYDIGKKETVVQHLYWFAAMGVNAVTCDWTNYTNDPKDANRAYFKDIYRNTENFLKTAQEMLGNSDFPVAKMYPTVRLFGEDYDLLESVLDDVYGLYEQYSDVWYKFDNSDKPFVVIFADWDLLNDKWIKEPIPFKDDRFDIRWSNGHLNPSTVKDKEGRSKIPENKPYWLFVEEVKAKEEGYYEVFYKQGKDKTVEQMMCWAAIYNGWSQESDSPWDGMDQIYDGKTTFERSLKDVKKLSPKALLVNRFNYPMAWTEHPYEGISLNDSVHIEPNRDLGFTVFNNVTKNLYDLNNWTREAPPGSVASRLSNQSVKIPLKNYPLEYRISGNGDFTDSKWMYLNINEWISFEEFADLEGFYIQTKNAFGESEVVFYDIM